ncbi:MAG: TIGR02281 family clan AA aspartic protease [Alphaproteobacteria bacterium]|nr:TIGR02281 family clan AA aspartic protease [Alphaproteobacteria bacterium]
MLGWLALLLALLLALFYFLTGEGSSVSDLSGSERWLFIGGATLLVFYALVLMSANASRLSQSLKQLGIWAGLILLLVAGYSYRGELGEIAYRVTGELSPPGTAQQTSSAGNNLAVRLRRRSDGHFVARGAINGASTPMLVDTGASTVVLKPADAERAGINVSNLAFTAPVSTANGTTFAAPVRLRSIDVGGIILEDVEALVTKPGSLNESLLGMSFLRRLRSYEFSGDFLTLRS